MPKPGWYVVQVETGRERRACEIIERVCNEADEKARIAAEEAACELMGDAADAAAGELAPEAAYEPAGELAPDAADEAAGELAPDAAYEAAGELAPEASDEAAGELAPEAAYEPAGELAPEASDVATREATAGTADEPIPDPAPLLQEVFAPSYQSRFKLHGEWHDEERLLLPGYVVAVTARPWRLAHVLHGVPAFTRILTMGETFAPLSDNDRSWIERWTREGDRTIPMSIAYKEGDRVVVTEGPLKGQEAMIVRVRRRQCTAELEMHVGQVTIRANVGLAVLPEPEEAGE